MPRATVSAESTERKDLKSAPPDGFVVLRHMSYGEVVQRRALMKLSVQASKHQKDFKGEMAMASSEIAMFEFQHCIVDHNLEDETGRKLNLGSTADFNKLDPRVGQEIEKYINEMNNLEEDEEENS